MVKKSYEDNGILLSQKAFYIGDKVKLSYTGLLTQAGAQSVFLHIGFGDEWENCSLIPMKLEQGTFSVEFEVLDSKSFGVCFKDSAENWDNNSGENYVFSVSKKPAKKVIASKSAKVEAPKTDAPKAKASKTKISTKAKK